MFEMGIISFLSEFFSFENLSFSINITAILIMLFGFVRAVLGFLITELRIQNTEKQRRLQSIRCQFGGYLLFGLELMIMADVIDTITHHSLEELIYLSVIIVLRTILSYFLGMEMKEIAIQEQLAEGRST